MFNAGDNNSSEFTEENRERGVWSDNTTQPNRYDDFVEAVSSYADLESLGSEINVLDVGCSTGEAARSFADKLDAEYQFGVNVDGVDISESAVSTASETLDHAYTGRAQDLDFGDGQYDLVTSKTLLSRINSDDQQEALQEINRVVNSEGYAVIQVDENATDRVVTGTSYVLSGTELDTLSELTESFEKPVGQFLEPENKVSNHQPEKERPNNVQEDPGYLGTTVRVAEEIDGSENPDDQDILIGS